jgi:hypothetical protein
VTIKTEQKMQVYFQMLPLIILMIRVVLFAIQHERKMGEKRSLYTISAINNPIKRRYDMKLNFARKIKLTDPLFNGYFIEVKALYILQFDKVPSICFLGNVDTEKSFAYITKKFYAEIVTIYQHSYFDHEKQESLLNYAVFVMTQNRMIELSNGFVQVLYQPQKLAEVQQLIKVLAEFKMAPTSAFQTQVVGFARQPEMN